MLKTIKRIFGIKEKAIWSHNRSELAELPVGTVIIDNGGITEGFLCVEWKKGYTGTWSNGSSVVSSIVSDEYFQMPFTILEPTS